MTDRIQQRKSTGTGRGRRSVTIKDLARELDLSITTISRALNGYDDVGEKTRQRVEEKAAKLGYLPNRNAQRLVTQRTHNIAWVQSDNDQKFVDPHFVEVMAGVLRGARRGRYDVVLSGHPPDEQIDVYNRYVKDNSVDGFIIDLPQPNDPRISYLLESGKPFIVHGRGERWNEYSWVDIDNFGIFKSLTHLMVANGHKKIAFINGDEQFSFALNRRKGVIAALDELQLPHETVAFYNTVHPMGEAGFQLTQQAIRDADVTAILYSSVLMAVVGHSALVRAGRRIGEDIAIATMDDQLHYLDLSPYEERFTFVRSSLRDAGYVLISELISQIETGTTSQGVVIPHHFFIHDMLDAAGILDG